MDYIYERHYCSKCDKIQVCIVTGTNKVECLECDKKNKGG